MYTDTDRTEQIKKQIEIKYLGEGLVEREDVHHKHENCRLVRHAMQIHSDLVS
jgi:hypothetical protein